MHYNLAGLFAAHKQERSAIEEYRIALAGKPNWPDAEDRLAYLLATAQEPKLRDAIEALRLAEHAALEARRQDKAAADTLAAIPIHTPPSLRPEALEQAGALRHDTQRQEAQVLEVLAALQAYAGHFDQAARTAAEAAQVAQDACLTDLAATLAEEVRFYHAQQPATLAPQTQPLSRMPEGLSR